jgi:DNA-binding transcriptional ArsR family regulator
MPIPRRPISLDVTAVLHALADPVHLHIVRQLSESGTAIACRRLDTPIAKNTVSHHFKILREAGIIATHPEGGQRLNVLRTAELEFSIPVYSGRSSPRLSPDGTQRCPAGSACYEAGRPGRLTPRG